MSKNNQNNDDDDGEDADGMLPEDAIVEREKPMGFFDHLEELRWALLKCVLVYIACAVVIAFFIRDFNHLLLWPLDVARMAKPQLEFDLGTTSITESFSVVINLCALGALLPSFPFFFFFAGQFIAPALTKRELRMVLPVCLASLVLFLAGSALSFFLMVPNTIKFAAEVNEWFGFILRWTPGSYYSMLSWLTIGAGASFQAPLVILLLVHLGFLKTKTLVKFRRHTIVAILILVALVSPTPDPVTQAFFAVPLYLLFELSIILGRRAERARRERAIAAGEYIEDEDADGGAGAGEDDADKNAQGDEEDDKK